MVTPTKIQIWNRALYHLGGRGRLETDTDDVEARYVFETIWDFVLEDALSRGDWHFATRTHTGVRNTTVTPVPGYFYTFDKPADWMRTLSYAHNDFFDDEYRETLSLRDEGQYWYSIFETLFVRYISSSFAADDMIQFYPHSYVEYVALLLARDSVERLTQSNSLHEKLIALTDRQLRKAKSINARNEKEALVRYGSWANALRGDADRRDDNAYSVAGVIVTRKGGI